eukprot:4632016-Pleurochrysis_carterae.AAC.3
MWHTVELVGIGHGRHVVHPHCILIAHRGLVLRSWSRRREGRFGELGWRLRLRGRCDCFLVGLGKCGWHEGDIPYRVPPRSERPGHFIAYKWLHGRRWIYLWQVDMQLLLILYHHRRQPQCTKPCTSQGVPTSMHGRLPMQERDGLVLSARLEEARRLFGSPTPQHGVHDEGDGDGDGGARAEPAEAERGGGTNGFTAPWLSMQY